MEQKIFDDTNFESALQQRVDGYRMYPSDAHWKQLHNRLHRRQGSVSIFFNALCTLLLVGLYIPTSFFQHQLAPLPQQKKPGTTMQVSVAAVPLARKASGTYLHLNTPLAATPVNAVITNAGTVMHAALAANESTGAALEQLLHEYESGAAVIRLVPPQTAASNPVLYASQDLIENMEPTIHIEATNTLTDKELNYEVSLPTATRMKRPAQLLFHAAPSMSHRVLIADNKIVLGNFDPETKVSHAASIGWEAGVAALLPVSDRVRIRLGAQFNYTRYTVSASQASPEISNVMLTTSARMQRVSTLRNTNSGLPRQLANETLQFSIPVGIEYQMAGNNRLSWNIAGTLQPTYMLAATGYLVSTDYRNYFKAPELMRRLNLNTSLETFVRFHAGKFDLQAGPQLRYQMLSTATGIYPIREHLVDYGFKLGIIRTLR